MNKETKKFRSRMGTVSTPPRRLPIVAFNNSKVLAGMAAALKLMMRKLIVTMLCDYGYLAGAC